jgi:hypothetical protein
VRLPAVPPQSGERVFGLIQKVMRARSTHFCSRQRSDSALTAFDLLLASHWRARQVDRSNVNRQSRDINRAGVQDNFITVKQ